MNTSERPIITISTLVAAPVQKVWDCWNDPAHITQWNQASPEWHAPHASNDLRPGGQLNCRMEAKDGSMGFDFIGEYTLVEAPGRLEYFMPGDGRKVQVTFTAEGENTRVTETFEAEGEHSLELQEQGWAAILDSFKRHTEAQ
jgi:uncharacterized protein YndB with AHSA1/START domain